MDCACVTSPCPCSTDKPLPGVSDVSVMDAVAGTIRNIGAAIGVTDNGAVDGGVNGAGPAPQDVPPGDTRSVTDGTATTANHDTAPSITRLLFNTITLGTTGPTLFSCRPDSWLCASPSGITSPNPPVSGVSSSITTPLILAVAGLVLVLLIVRRISP